MAESRVLVGKPASCSTPLLAGAHSPHFISSVTRQGHVAGMLARAESSSVSQLMEGTRNFGILDGDGDSSTVHNPGGKDSCDGRSDLAKRKGRTGPCSEDSDVVDDQQRNIKTGEWNNESSGTSTVMSDGKGKNVNYKAAFCALRRNPKRRRNNGQMEEPCMAPGGQQQQQHHHKSVVAKKTNSIFLAEKARACTECGKEFSSWKALFGHMRCHPEREWRGILPPQGVRQERETMMIMANGSSSSVPRPIKQVKFHSRQMHGQQQQEVERNKSPLPQLALEAHSELESLDEKAAASDKVLGDDSDTESIETAYINDQKPQLGEAMAATKRYRRPKAALNVNSVEDETHGGMETVKNEGSAASTPREIREQRDMAHCLVMLSSAARPVDDEYAVSDNRDRVTMMEERAESIESEAAKKFPWELVCYPKKEQSQSRNLELVLANDHVEAAGSVQPEEVKQGGFECGTCKKIFRSHQALGGHRASHKKVKGCFARTINADGVPPQESLPEEDVITTEDLTKSDDNNTISAEIAASEQIKLEETIAYRARTEAPEFAAAEMTKKTKASSGHQCSICSRVFSTGQALGGHKRCHWGAGDNSSKNEAAGASINKPAMAAPPITYLQCQPKTASTKGDFLDLNLPAPVEEEEEDQMTDEQLQPKFHADFELRMCSASLDSMKRAGEFLSLSSGMDKKNYIKAGQNYNYQPQQQQSRRKDPVDNQLRIQRTSSEMNMKYSVKRFQCNLCSKLVATVEALNDHIKRSHDAVAPQFCLQQPPL